MATMTLTKLEVDASAAAPVGLQALAGGTPEVETILALALGQKARSTPAAHFPLLNEQLAGVGADEEWRSIPDWPEYEVSEIGEVRRIRSANGTPVCRRLKPSLNRKTGYLSVCLCRNYRQSRIDIHRLVAIAFLGPPPSPRHLVAHNDGTRTHNHRSNLRWATQRENLADCRSHGTAMAGSRNPCARIDEIDVKAIRRMKAAGIPRPVIAEGFGIHKRRVFSILSGDSWGHVR